MGDIFRRNYGAPTQEQRDLADRIKAKAEELLGLYAQPHREPTYVSDAEYAEKADAFHAAGDANRCSRVAMTRLEESVMWAVKAVMTEVPRG